MKNNLIAQIPVEVKGPGNSRVITGGPDSGNIFADIISATIGAMTVIAAIWFIFNIITGGLSIIGSAGDPAKVEAGRNKITNGAIGLVVVLSAILVLGLVSTFLGIDNLLKIDAWINTISIK